MRDDRTSSASSGRAVGVVKFWNAAKGWGAITSPDLPEGRDAWVLWSHVAMEGYTKLCAGQLVEFEYHAQHYESFDFVADLVIPLDDAQARSESQPDTR